MALNRPLHNLITTTGNPATRSSSSLVTPQLQAYADPQFTPTVDPTLLNYLTIRALGESERAATKRQRDHRNAIQQQIAALRLSTSDDAAAVKPVLEEEEEHGAPNPDDAAVRARFDAIGYRVGWATAERLARDRPRFPPPSSAAPPLHPPSSSSSSASGSSTPIAQSLPTQQQPRQGADILELVKFICKDVWVAVFDKQVDNLRTNHRGVYVLYDQRLAALKAVPPRDSDNGEGGGEEEDKEEREALQRHVDAVLAFPSGLIRGALANLDVECTVTGTADLTTLPQASFQIKTTPSPPPPPPPSSAPLSAASASTMPAAGGGVQR
ncbi:Trafficking protein particle complex subunit 33 [Rhodotorula mucilaginosa]|uniref:Trafficking protein particle complex subunit 33 n=1 Tax=Rhodotorula mucilaginosa TaxID=5537 RepID=A0A9P6VX78_RHOMI|nr:Trafficking protein particle complex subunit 33 [Rhodotorula mucilaginosa]TKA55818.1 hypothetical protein B0A53_02956 [Rhodotorula sp. CCFEE 5036]